MRKYAIVIFLFAAIGGACSSSISKMNSNTHSGMNHNSTVDHTNMNHGNTKHSDMKSSPNAADAPFDLQFIDTMIVHHQGAIEMAKMAETKAENPELKTLSKNIVTAQENEIAQMKSWRDVTFADRPPAVNMDMPGMNDSMKDMDMNRFDRLSGKEFDIEFVKQMIPHHEGAVAMAKEALQKSSDGRIRNLAASIIKDQEIEIDQMANWK